MCAFDTCNEHASSDGYGRRTKGEEGRRFFGESFKENPLEEDSILNRPFCIHSISPFAACLLLAWRAPARAASSNALSIHIVNPAAGEVFVIPTRIEITAETNHTLAEARCRFYRGTVRTCWLPAVFREGGGHVSAMNPWAHNSRHKCPGARPQAWCCTHC